MAILTAKDGLEAFNGFFEGHQFAQMTSEDLGHLEGLGQETLDLTGAGHRQLVLLGQLVHTQDGNDILEGLVVLEQQTNLLVLYTLILLKKSQHQASDLEDFLHATSDVVMLSSYDVGVHDTGGGVQGVDGGVDTQLSNGTGQHSGGVQVGEGGGGGRVSQIISRHVDGLAENKSSLGLILST